MTKNGLSLTAKLTLISSLLVIIAITISVVVTAYIGQQIGRESIDRKLSASQSVHEVFAEQRALQLELISQLVASEPAFVAYIAQATLSNDVAENEANNASIADLLLERQQQYGFDFALTTDSEGQQLARSDQRIAVSRDLATQPLLRRAIQELIPVNGYWREGQSLFQAAAVPLARGRNLVGFLVTGLKVDDNLSSEIGRLSGADVTIAMVDQGKLISQSSTFDIPARNALLEEFTNTLGVQELTSGNIKAGQTLTVNGRNWALDVLPLGRQNDESQGAIIAMVSVDEVLRPFTSGRNILLGLGLLTLLITLISSYFLARKTLSPVRQLSDAAKDAADGKYETQIDDQQQDDLSDLRSSINRLTNNLQGREALDKHMVEVSKSISRTDYRRIAPTATGIQLGTVIGSRFEIMSQIGAGGMGYVFQAYDRELDEIVALKVMKPTTTEDQDIARFKDEIRLARRVTHPHVVRIYDYGKIGENIFISMEFVRGYTIEQILKHSKRLRPHAGMRICLHTCKGLMAAHDAGIVHRDLKPANLIVELDSTVKLMDFGIATPVNKDLAAGRKTTIEGTVKYLSPEQIQGLNADERSDVYALGAVMTEIFSGNLPFSGNTAEELMLKHAQDVPTRLTEFWHDAPERLEQIILKCLEKDPQQRYQNIKSLHDDLAAVRL